MSSTLAVARMPSPECAEDVALAGRFASGDEQAFCEVAALYGPRVASLARRLLGWPDGVEDVVQEVFLTALKRQRTFRRESKLSTWLMGITVNQCRRSRRSANRKWNFLSKLWTHASRDPEEHDKQPVELAEEQSQVRDAIRGLPDALREVLVLRYLEEMAPMEIAGVLGITTNLVNVRLSRAREKLQVILAGIMEEERW